MRPIIDLNGFFRELELDEVLNTMFDSKLVQAGLAKNCCSRDQNGLIGWSFLCLPRLVYYCLIFRLSYSGLAAIAQIITTARAHQFLSCYVLL